MCIATGPLPNRISRDDYSYSPPGGNNSLSSSGASCYGNGGGYHAPPTGYQPMAPDPYCTVAQYVMAPALPPSPGRGGHVDIGFAPYGMRRGGSSLN